MMSWVLMVTSNSERDQAVREELEEAGFGVEIVADIDAALECLAVMKPALLVVDDRHDSRRRDYQVRVTF